MEGERPYQSLPFASTAVDGTTNEASSSGRDIEDRPASLLPAFVNQISLRHFGLYGGNGGGDVNTESDLVEPEYDEAPPPFVRAVRRVRERVGEALQGVGAAVKDFVDVALHDPRRFSTYFSISTRVGGGDSVHAGRAAHTTTDGDDDDPDMEVADRNFTPLSGIFRTLRVSPPVRWARKTPFGKWFVRNIIGTVEEEQNVHYSRLIDRDGKFFQSMGRMAIKKKIRSEDWHALYVSRAR